MITINLLAPGKRRRVAGPKAPVSILPVLVVVGVAVLLFVVGAGLYSKVSRLQHQLVDLNTEVQKLRPIADQVHQLEGEQRALGQRLGVLQQLLGTQLPAYEALEAMRGVIPKDVWLVGMTTSGTKGVVFEGYTFSYKSVARFMVDLADSEKFRNVDLTSTQRDRVQDRDVVKFQITGELSIQRSPVSSKVGEGQ